GLADQAEHAVTVQAARMSLKLNGPPARYVDQPADWEVRVANAGEVPLNNVVVRDRLPPELAFQSATEGGRFDGTQVVWSLGGLGPGGEKRGQVTAKGARAARAVNVAEATADPGQQERAEAATEVRGLSAVRVDLYDLNDPVPVGGRTSYKIVVQNQGTSPADG